MKHNGLFMKGIWTWDKYDTLTARDGTGKIIDTVAVLRLEWTDNITRSATKRVISYAPEMYSCLENLSKNLRYSNLSRDARRDVRDMLNDIDYGMYTCNHNKRLTAYAADLLDFVKAVSESETDTEGQQNLREKAKKLIEIIGGEDE